MRPVQHSTDYIYSDVKAQSKKTKITNLQYFKIKYIAMLSVSRLYLCLHFTGTDVVVEQDYSLRLNLILDTNKTCLDSFQWKTGSSVARCDGMSLNLQHNLTYSAQVIWSCILILIVKPSFPFLIPAVIDKLYICIRVILIEKSITF